MEHRSERGWVCKYGPTGGGASPRASTGRTWWGCERVKVPDVESGREVEIVGCGVDGGIGSGFGSDNEIHWVR